MHGVGADRDAAPAGVRPGLGVAGFARREHPGGAGAARQRVVDAVHLHVGEDVVVAVEEDLHPVLQHQRWTLACSPT